MRLDGFLRVPVRCAPATAVSSVSLAETALAGDPSPAATYPQTLELTVALDQPDRALEVVPLWEGALRFLPDSTSGNPTTPAEVRRERYDRWSVTGDLVLTAATIGPTDHAAALARHLPLLDPPPTLVRYSPVRLTPDFLFTTLRTAPRRTFHLGGATVTADDPLHAEKMVLSLLSGTGWLWCSLDPTDPARDVARLPMPVVAGNGPTRALRLTCATTADEVLVPSWFDQRPAFDDLPGVPLVAPAVVGAFGQRFTDPAHPASSVVPARAVFATAAAAAFAPDADPAGAVRSALTAPLPGGLHYRRVSVQRPPTPGPDAGAAPRRPFPQHQLCWRPSAGGATESLRLPLSGSAYLPLPDGSYRFWVVPRSADPNVLDHGEQVLLSAPPIAPSRVGGLPAPTLDVALGAASGTVLHAHLREFDSAFVWEGYRQVAPGQVELQNRAGARWNVDATVAWLVPRRPVRPPQSALYGLLRESAGRHGLAPEFLQVVFFGEGGGLALPPGGAFDPEAALDAFGFVGLDLIVYRTGRLPVGRPAVPPEVPAGATDERAEYAVNLVTAGYVHPAVAARVTWTGTQTRSEAGYTRTLEVGTVQGWAAAVELVAAELHARLDEMTAYLAGKAPPVTLRDEHDRRFAAYVRFNASPARARQLVDHLDTAVRTWVGARPPGNEDARYNALQRLAVTDWHEEAGAYRGAQLLS